MAGAGRGGLRTGAGCGRGRCSSDAHAPGPDPCGWPRAARGPDRPARCPRGADRLRSARPTPARRRARRCPRHGASAAAHRSALRRRRAQAQGSRGHDRGRAADRGRRRRRPRACCRAAVRVRVRVDRGQLHRRRRPDPVCDLDLGRPHFPSRQSLAPDRRPVRRCACLVPARRRAQPWPIGGYSCGGPMTDWPISSASHEACRSSVPSRFLRRTWTSTVWSSARSSSSVVRQLNSRETRALSASR